MAKRTAEQYKRDLLEEARDRYEPKAILDNLDSAWDAAYSAANPAARSWKGMLQIVELKVYMLLGKPGVAELPADDNAISSLIRQVMAIQVTERIETVHSNPKLPVQ